MIFGLQGACRRHELCNMTIDNIKDKQDSVIVHIPLTKTDKPRTFVITNEFYGFYKEYAQLRPANLVTKKLFIHYSKGKCTNQHIGINTIGSMPKIVAEQLGLEDPGSYTRHSYRRTSTTLLADAGASKEDIKRHGGWKSDAVAEGYIEESIGHKRKIAKMIAGTIVDNNTKKLATESNVHQINSNLHTIASSAHQLNSNVYTKENRSEAVYIPKSSTKNVTLQISNCNNITVVLEDNKKCS